MTCSELERKLRNAGCQIVREGSRHRMWRSPITNETFPVPRHKTEEIKKGTLNSILKAAGLK